MQSDREIHILTIQGEGVRAIIPLTVLDHMEEHLNPGVRFVDYFDVIEGTASGADCIVKGLKTNISADNLMKHYRDGKDLVKASVEGKISPQDPTISAIQQAENQFPGNPLFIVTLGAGSVPDYNMNSPENVAKSTLYHLVNDLRTQGRIIDHITIDTSIGQDLANPTAIKNVDALRQAGLSLCNRQNPRGFYEKIQQIVTRINDAANKK